MEFVLMIFLLIAGSGYCISNEQNVWNAINNFSSLHYKQLINEQNGNGVYSPINTWGMIYQLRNTTANQTADQLQAVIYLNETTDSQITKEFYNNITGVHTETTFFFDFEKISGLCILFFGCSDQIALKEVSKYWKLGNITVENTKLDNFEVAAKSISTTISNNTNSQIKQIITYADKEANIQVIGVDLFQFESMWADKFDVNKTKEKDFILNNGTVRSIPMMNKQGSYKYGVLLENSAEFIQLSFENKTLNDSGLSMVVIVPDKKQDLKVFETKLINISLSVFDAANYSTVDLYLPKFQIATKTDLKSSFNALGLIDMFTDSASFVINDLKMGKISKIIQETSIEINEDGCNSLLSSKSVALKRERRSIPEGKQFLVNRPFFVLIRHRNNVILRARIFDPSLSTSDYLPRTTEASLITTPPTMTISSSTVKEGLNNSAMSDKISTTTPTISPIQTKVDTTVSTSNLNNPTSTGTPNVTQSSTTVSSGETSTITNKPITNSENTTLGVNNTSAPTESVFLSFLGRFVKGASNLTAPMMEKISSTFENTDGSNTNLKDTTTMESKTIVTSSPTATISSSKVKEGLNNPAMSDKISMTTGTPNVAQSSTIVSSGETSTTTNKPITNLGNTTLGVNNTSPTTENSVYSIVGSLVKGISNLTAPMMEKISSTFENTSGSNTNLKDTTTMESKTIVTSSPTTTISSSSVKEGPNNAAVTIKDTNGSNTNSKDTTTMESKTIVTSSPPSTISSSSVKEGLNNVSNTNLNNPTSTGTPNVTQSSTTGSSEVTSTTTKKPANQETTTQKNTPSSKNSASHAAIFPVALILMTTALFFA